MHYLFIFPVLHDSVKVLAFYRLEANFLKNTLYLFYSEIVSPSFVAACVEVLLYFRCPPFSEPQLRQIVKTVVSKVQYRIVFKLAENLLSYQAMLLRSNGGQNEY
jgi:hypothetical protein